VTRLWKMLFNNVLLCEFMKVAKLVVVQIMSFMEDDNTFSTLTFMKARLRKVVYVNIWMFTQPFIIDLQLIFFLTICHHSLD